MLLKLTAICCVFVLSYETFRTLTAAAVPLSFDVKINDKSPDDEGAVDISASRPRKECADHGDCHCTVGVSFCYKGECFCVWSSDQQLSSDLNYTVIANFLNNSMNQVQDQSRP